MAAAKKDAEKVPRTLVLTEARITGGKRVGVEGPEINAKSQGCDFVQDLKESDISAKLANLQLLALWGNKLAGLPSSLQLLKRLRYLSLENNKVVCIRDMHWVRLLPELEVFNIAQNEIEVLPDYIGEMKQLRVLFAYNNKIHQLPRTLRKLHKLEKCSLETNKLQYVPLVLGKLARDHCLAEVNLRNNPGIPSDAEKQLQGLYSALLAKATALFQLCFSPKWTKGADQRAKAAGLDRVFVPCRHSAFEPKLLRLILTFLDSAYQYKDRHDDENAQVVF